MNKNLKKVISAVAALTVSASSIAAFAVDFPDVESDASYAQAVQELSALGIINGFEDGTFKPDELVTRAQISTMIVAALAETSSAEASKAASKFTDVASGENGHWAIGYINQGTSDGWISGMGDGTFAPDDNVNFVQAQKMLVAAIGYDTYAQAQGGWPSGYKLYANSLNITKGLSGITDDTQLTRAQVAQMIDNAMDAPLCIIKSWTTEWNGTKTPNLEVKDGEGKDYQTLFTNKHKAYKVYGRVTDTTKANPSLEAGTVEFQVEKADNFDDQYVTSSDLIDPETMYVGESKADEYIRTYSQALIQKDDDDEYTIISLTPAAANKSVTLAAEDFDDSKSTYENLYFYPAGTTRSSVKYALDTENGVTVYVNGVEQDIDYVDYINSHETASVTLQKETNVGSTSSSTKYNVIMISSYATAVVDEVIDKTNEISINFKAQSVNKSRMTLEKDDDNYTYTFTLDGETIDATDLEEFDVLNIAYDTADFASSNFYDVIVTRNTVDDVKCTGISTKNNEYTIGGDKYSLAEGMDPGIEQSSTYKLYLDHFGRIAYADESSVAKNIGILRNIYKKAGGDYMAQIITKEGAEEEYKVDEKNLDDYTAILGTTADDPEVTYTSSGDGSKLDKYPDQVIEYSVSSSSNKITIKNDAKALNGTTSTNEYKSSSDKIGSVKLSDATVILDISDINKDEYSVISKENLVDGNDYTAVGYDKSSSDSIHRFVLITDGFNGLNSTTQLAVFQSSELIEDGDDERTAYNIVINGEETQVILDDDTVDPGFSDGDVIMYTENGGYVRDVYSIFTDTDMLDSTTYEDFRDMVLAANGKGIIVDTLDGEPVGEQLSDNNNDDVNLVFGPVVNKKGNTVVIGTIEDKQYVNYDTGFEVDTRDAKVYAYDFGASSKYSRVLLDNGMQATPDSNAAVSTNAAGEDILDLTDEDVVDDIVFAVARVIDDDVQEIYLILNN